ncbi:MAG TPA: hypothetical protein VF785_00200 [Gemmatimonadaceae bacterium]
MRSRLLLLASSVVACLAALPAAASAQYIVHRGHIYRPSVHSRYDYSRDDIHDRVDRALRRAQERADRAEERAYSRSVERADDRAYSRSVERAESRTYAAQRRMDRQFFRDDLATRIRERINAGRARSRYRW